MLFESMACLTYYLLLRADYNVFKSKSSSRPLYPYILAIARKVTRMLLVAFVQSKRMKSESDRFCLPCVLTYLRYVTWQTNLFFHNKCVLIEKVLLNYTLLLEPKVTRPKVEMPMASDEKHVLVFFGINCYLCCLRLQYLHIREKQPFFVLGFSTPHIGNCFSLALLHVFIRTALQEIRLVTKYKPFASKVASFV